MNFSLCLLNPARKELDKLDDKRAKIILDKLEELMIDPFKPRPGIDIVKVEKNKMPLAYRLRVGRLRIEYLVVFEDHRIVVFSIFLKKRSSDYR
jgi:mRNA-degrading endonuclease RelE of RelBE toxin-antitoxin system